jgi:hypothetical protein
VANHTFGLLLKLVFNLNLLSLQSLDACRKVPRILALHSHHKHQENRPNLLFKASLLKLQITNLLEERVGYVFFFLFCRKLQRNAVLS